MKHLILSMIMLFMVSCTGVSTELLDYLTMWNEFDTLYSDKNDIVTAMDYVLDREANITEIINHCNKKEIRPVTLALGLFCNTPEHELDYITIRQELRKASDSYFTEIDETDVYMAHTMAVGWCKIPENTFGPNPLP